MKFKLSFCLLMILIVGAADLLNPQKTFGISPQQKIDRELKVKLIGRCSRSRHSKARHIPGSSVSRLCRARLTRLAIALPLAKLQPALPPIDYVGPCSFDIIVTVGKRKHAANPTVRREVFRYDYDALSERPKGSIRFEFQLDPGENPRSLRANRSIVKICANSLPE